MGGKYIGMGYAAFISLVFRHPYIPLHFEETNALVLSKPEGEDCGLSFVDKGKGKFYKRCLCI